MTSITTDPFPSSQKIHIASARFPDVSVAMREISLSPKSGEANVRIYDTSGAYTDPSLTIDIRKGLPKLRSAWIEERGDVEHYEGRAVKPEDNGLTASSATRSAAQEIFPNVPEKPFRACVGKNVTQMHYARRGIITKEMEYIAVRENLGRQKLAEAVQNSKGGESFGASISKFITAEFIPSLS